MARTAIETLLHMMDVAYRADPFSALRRNVESVRPDEWHVRPATWSVDEFGAQPELSICDIVMHVAGAKHMYADRAFGECKLEWGDIPLPPSRDMEAVLAWLEEGQRLLTEGLAALSDDSELARRAPDAVAPADAPPAAPHDHDQPRSLPRRRDQPAALVDPRRGGLGSHGGA